MSFRSLVLYVSLSISCAGAAAAAPLAVTAKLIPVNPTYFTAMDGAFSVKYARTDLPDGTRVRLHHGFTRSDWWNGELRYQSSWNETSIVDVPLARGGFTAEVTKQLYSRGSSSWYTGLDFALEIITPDGRVEWEKGSTSNFGYYHVDAPQWQFECARTGCDLSIQAVIKD